MDKTRGWAFPIQVDEKGRIVESGGEDMICQSICMILSTKVGERFLHPDFGCNLYTFMFSVIDYTTLKQMEGEVKRSLALWEKRITDVDATASVNKEEPHKVHIDITYRIEDRHEPLHYVHVVEMNV